MPLQYGAILEKIPFHEYENYNFKKGGRFAFPGELKRLIKMEADPHLTDLRMHLEHYRLELNQARAEFNATALESFMQQKKSYQSAEFAKFYKIYGDWLARTELEIQELILAL